MLYPFVFDNHHFKLVWGTEDWVISAVPQKESVVGNGSLRGKTLAQLVEMYGESLLGKRVKDIYGTTFPLLIKFIKAHDDLSIQVHPNNKLAMERHGCLGKTEMWFVMDAEPGAKLYSGFKEKISKYEYEHRVADGSIVDVLQEHPVKRGDVFFIPSGRVHAICGGITLAEIQQTSDVTYRIYDYNRPGLDGKPRQLHVKEAEDAIDYNVYPTYQTRYLEKINDQVAITECPYFTVKINQVSRSYHRKLLKYDSFVIYICLDGDAIIRMRDERCEVREIELRIGDTCLVPHECADLDLIPNNPSGETQLLEVYIDNKHFNQTE